MEGVSNGVLGVAAFLDGEALSAAVRRVCDGSQVCCAVAFWGRGMPDGLLGNEPSRARILCNVTLGGTNPKALEEAGAPNSLNLRCYDTLHAKVYLSRAGAVVASANASENGLSGGEKPALLQEAGVWLEPGTDDWKAAERWFESLWQQARPVDRAALDEAGKTWRRAARSRALAARLKIADRLKLPRLLEQCPDAFADVEFFVALEEADQTVIDRAVKIVRRQSGEEAATRLSDPHLHTAFTEWGGNPEAPERFVNIHRGADGTCWAALCSQGQYVGEKDVYFAPKHSLKDRLFMDLRERLNLGEPDQEKHYSLGKRAFTRKQLELLGPGFLTAEAASDLLWPKARGA